MLHLYTGMPTIDPETIGMAFNIGLFVIIGAIFLGFIVGLIRGIWKSGFRLLFIGGLVIAAFLASRPLTDLLASLDIGAIGSAFGFSFPPVGMTIGTTEIVVQITTIQATIESFVSQLVTAINLPASSGAQASELIIALTMVIMRYVVFIILGMLIVTVGELLATLLYFFPFRLFIPKNWRKKHKVRLIGGLLNAVKVALVTVMMMVPFSSLLNTINQAFRSSNNTSNGIDDPTYNQIMGFLDAYNDSLFAQVLFNWTVDANGKTLDTVLMDYVTGEQIDDFVLTLSGELHTIASIGATILSTGVITTGLNETTYPILLSENVIGSLITSLTGSALIMKALPIAIGVAMNMEEVQSFVDPSLIDLDGINWTDELNNVKQIAQDVAASGVLDNVLNPNNEFDPIDLILAMVNDTAYPRIRAALYGIDNSAFLAQVLPAVVYKLVSDELNAPEPPEGLGLSTFFPTDWQDYRNLRFGEEIALIYDVMHSIASLDPDLLPTIIDIAIPSDDSFFPGFDAATTGGTRTKTKGSTPSSPQYADNPQDALIDIVREHSDALIEIIVGALDNSGNPTGVDPVTGKTIIFDEDNEPIPGAKLALFDSGLLIHGLDELLDFALEPLLGALSGGGTFNRDNLDATVTWLNGTTFGEKRINYKGEFGAILGIVSAIFGNDTLLSLIFPEDEPASEGARLPGIKKAEGDDNSLLTLFGDVDFRNAFKYDICPLLDRSRIMGSVLPDVLETALTNPDIAATFTDLGLDPATFNFGFTDVGTQMGILIDIIGYSLSVVDNLDAILGDGDISPVVDDLIGLLDSLYISSIINPKDNAGMMTTDNYYGLLDSLFSRAGTLQVDANELDAAMRSVPHDGWATTYDQAGDPIAFGENYHLIKFLETALTSDLFNIDAGGDVLDQMIDFANDPSDPIGAVFNAVDSSVIISSTMGGIVDSLIGSAGGLIDTDLGSSFRNVTDWALEGQNLKDILIALEPFTSGIENIDFMNDDPVKVENILKAIARSQIFLTPDDEYLFGDFLLSKIKGEGSIMADYVFDPYEDETSPSPYDLITSDFRGIGQTRATASNWYGVGGEIDKIIAFVQAVQDFADGDPDPIGKLQNDPNITSTDVKPIMIALNDVGSMRIMLYNMFDMILGTNQFDIGSLRMSESNTYVLITLDKAEREIEIDYTFEVYRTIEELALNDGSSFSMDTITPEKIHEIENMLNALHDARLFNTFDTSSEPRSHALGFLTVFEQVIEMIFDASMMDSYIYKELPTPAAIDAQLRLDIQSIPNNFADATNPLDGWIGPSGEIKAITSILTSFKDTGLTFDDFGNDGANAFSNLMKSVGGPSKVETLMLDINGSVLAYPAIPNLFDEIFDSGAFAISDINLDETNTDFFRTESDESARASEITLLIDIHVGIDELDLTDGSSLQLSSIDGNNINTLLNNLHDSMVFNTFKTGYSHDDGDLTVFEQTIKMLYTVTNFSEHIYSDALPGDRAALLRDDIVAIGNDFAGTVPANSDGWTGPNGEIMTIRNILLALKDTDIDFDAMGDGGSLTTEFNNLLGNPAGQEKLEALMARINESEIAWPANPNLLEKIFGTSGFSITGVNLGDANPAYIKSLADVGERQQEIDKVFDIYDLVNSLGVNDGSPFDDSKLDTLIISDLLNALHDSFVFNTLRAGKNRLLPDVTVFEQMIEMIYDSSLMDTYIYAHLATPAAIDAALRADVVAIPNNFADTANLVDGWVGPSGEISAIINILESFKDTGLTFNDFGNDGANAFSNLMNTPAGPGKVETLMLDINESSIAYPAIPNLFDEIFLSGAFALDGVNLDEANTDFFRNEPMKSERATEITVLMDVYVGISTLELTDGSPLSPDKIDGDDINTLLNDLHISRVFNTFKTGYSHTSDDLTVFEQTIKMLYTVTNFTEHIYSDALPGNRANLLRDDIIAIGNNFANTVPANSDGWIGVSGEIITIRNILVALKDTDIDFDSMGDGAALSTEFNTLLGDPAGQPKLEALMARINESQIAWPANPNLLDRMFASAGFSISGVDLADSNPAYLKTMPNINERQQELDKVFEIYELLDSLGVNDGNPFDETKLDTVIIDDLLRALHESLVFNTLQTGKDRFLLDITVFEQMIYMLIDQSQLDAYIYEGLGPVDPLLKQDIIAIGNDFAGSAPLASDGWRYLDAITLGEITRIVGILEAFEDTGLTFASFSGAGSSDVLSSLIDTDAALVENLLLSMNHSQIVYPSIPNIFANMLTASDVSISGVDFADANTHYRGNRGDATLDNKYLPYDDGEITQLLTIYADTKDIAGTSYTNLTLISNQDIDNIKALAEQLYESHVFHLEGVPATSTSLATVFEQIIIKMMDDTGISSLINDLQNPNPLYYDGPIYKFASAHEKAEFLVVNFDTIYGASANHYTNQWDGASGEINALFRIFKELKRVLPSTSGAAGLDPSILAPTDISAILAVLNYSNLASDAIPDLVRDAFETISFDTYTEGNEDYYLTPVAYFNVDLTSMDYSTTDFTNLLPPTPGPTGLIHALLDEFYDEVTESYEDMGGAFNIGDFITSGHTSEPLLHLFDASLVFGNDVPLETYKTRALTFYNILNSADVARYIDFNNPTKNKTSKTNKIESIFATDFDYVFEAERLDLYIANLISFNTLSDASSIEGLGAEFRLLIEHTYELDLAGDIVDRAYLVSELSAGFFTDIFEEEYAKVIPEPDVIDFYAADYGNLNPREADGIEGALSILDEIDLILANTFDETDIARLRSHFVKMGSLQHTSVTGGPFPAVYDYSAWDSSGNSLIAKLFYAAEVIQNANFINFSSGLTTYAALTKFTVVVLAVDPYANDFVFEEEGDKIYFVYA